MPKKQTPSSMLPDSTAYCLRQLVEQGKARLKLERLRYALALRQEAKAQEVFDLALGYLKRVLAREAMAPILALQAYGKVPGYSALHPQGGPRLSDPVLKTVIHGERMRRKG